MLFFLYFFIKSFAKLFLFLCLHLLQRCHRTNQQRIISLVLYIQLFLLVLHFLLMSLMSLHRTNQQRIISLVLYIQLFFISFALFINDITKKFFLLLHKNNFQLL